MKMSFGFARLMSWLWLAASLYAAMNEQEAMAHTALLISAVFLVGSAILRHLER